MRKFLSIATAAILVFIAMPAHALVLANSFTFPPAGSAYQGDARPTGFGGIGSFFDVFLTINDASVRVEPIPGSFDEIFTFQVLGAMQWETPAHPPAPVALRGAMRIVLGDHAGARDGMFRTELLSLELAGADGGTRLTVRESPTLPSPGLTTIRGPGGGGMYSIDSFFDVFTELSLDGGPFTPAQNPVRLNLVSATVPAPGTLALLAGGLALIGGRRRGC